MTTYYWSRFCPTCKEEGQLFIVEDLTLKRLYLHCDECEQGFVDPRDVDSGECFLTLTRDYDYKIADLATIERYGWKEFALCPTPEADAPNL